METDGMDGIAGSPGIDGIAPLKDGNLMPDIADLMALTTPETFDRSSDSSPDA